MAHKSRKKAQSDANQPPQSVGLISTDDTPAWQASRDQELIDQMDSFCAAVDGSTLVGKAVRAITAASVTRETLAQACKRYGIAYRDAARIRKTPEFRAAIQSAIEDEVAPMMPAVLAATFRSALLLGRPGAADRQLLLRLGGVYQPSASVDHTGTVDHKHSVADRLAYAQAQRGPMLEQASGFEGQRVVDGHDPDTGDGIDPPETAETLEFE